jgi:hypothetical protein
MAGIKGMKIKKSHEDSPRFAEYYKKQNPELTIEQCEEKAKLFRHSCNYQCIEYYEKNYPELSHEEHLKLKKQLQIQKKQNNPLNLEYYIKNYPELSKEEQENLWHKYTKENCYQNEEYYIKRGATKEEAKELKRKKLEIVTPKIVAKISGQNNGMSSTNRTEQQRKEASPFAKEFYIKRGLSEEDRKKFNENIAKNRSYNTQLEYYINKGMSEEEAHKALYNRQATFSLYKCIQKYGEEKGLEIFNNRQKVWNKKLQKAFKLGKYTQSPIANNLFNLIKEKLNLIDSIEEKYVFNDELHKGYLFDFCLGNKLIEFNGDYWHANPILYGPKSFIKAKNKRAEDIWEYDKIKIQTAENQGYKVLIIWEYDYNNNKEEALKKCIDFLTND